MNEIHFHLVVNHLPIIFPLVGLIVLVIGLISKSEDVKRTAYLIFVMGALATILSMFSGEEAEESIEKLNIVSDQFIKIHEEAAETFAVLSYVLGLISALWLWFSFKRKNLTNTFSMIVIILVLIVLFFATQTGTTGGEIRHIEIREENPVK